MFSFQKRKHKKSKLLKTKSVKKERLPDLNTGEAEAETEHFEPLRSAALKASDLKDGLRLLILQEGKFLNINNYTNNINDVDNREVLAGATEQHQAA